MRLRRYLPNLSLLLAFDGLMRCGSVTGAARELGLTQSTVSRLVQTLEEQLGQPLFLRHRRRLIPTDAASRYHQDVSAALDLIQRGSMSLIANPEGGSINLAVLPTFGTRWLAPRLPAFMTRHPGILVNLTTRFQSVSFSTEPFDAAIIYHQGETMQDHSLRLFDESLTACASPAFLAAHPISEPDDLTSLVLLHLQTRPDAWADWFRGQGAQAMPSGGMVMDQFSMMIQAAISGLGVALLPDYLARQEIAEGHLLPILRPAVPGRGAYLLVWPRTQAESRPLVHFRDWLAAEVA
ncbi:LysR family transcriptional regulator [Paracoccus benzoatiresistens]|uniref:LysR family transcriptional regulator n=1 Tax=Paracoccus benzoatiresistens TaxID=2997341 RepID=A0ABT4JAH8_9RHOB|nr:LysR family transcriptional regulator [Paracoccus sp. EF6]MCZ0963612.1 LysR family transcriptional regulator [Paracoccus sp. EF6]